MNYNPLTKQVLDLPNLVDVQLENIRKSLDNAIDTEALKKFRRIYITGSGDSFIAGNTALKAFRKFSNEFGNKVMSLSPIDITRFEKFRGNTPPENILVIGISASGGPARIYEALTRASSFGYATLAITNNPESRVAKAADYVLNVNTPPGDNSPGLRSYFASQAALFMLAARYGKVRGVSDFEEELVSNIKQYVKEYEVLLPNMYNDLESFSKENRNALSFAYIGDDLDFQTAWFGAATMIEVSGHMCTHDDSESWCHVNHFADNPNEIPLIFNASRDSNSITRVMETLNQADQMGHPTLLVIDNPKTLDSIPPTTTVITLPNPIKGYDFITNLMSHTVTSIMSSLVAEYNNEPYFRAGQFDNDVFTIQNSEIVIVGKDND